MQFEDDNGRGPERAQLLVGAGWWLAFSIVAIALRGVRWDETYEWAQVLLGEIRYPEAHPINRFVWSAYTIQHYVTAAALYLVDEPLLINGARNALVLAFGTIAVFLWASHLARRVVWGHAAVALALFNVLTPFETTYPLRVWPHCFSDGPIGLGWALSTLFMVLTQRWRIGFFMLAAMPVVHIGQMPAVLATCGLFTIVMWTQGKRRAILSALPFAAMGFAICVALAIVLLLKRVPEPTEGPYYATGDAWQIWSNYKEVWYHTTIRGGINAFLQSHIAAVMALLLPMPWALRALREKRYDDVWLWVFVFASITVTAVWTAMWIHSTMGADVPFLVIGWMPYRLANHLPFLVLCMSFGILASDRRGVGVALILFGLSVAALVARPFLSEWLSNDLYARYVADGAWTVYLIVGAAFAQLSKSLRAERSTPLIWAALSLTSLIVLAALHQFAVGTIVLGVLAFHALSLFPWRDAMATRLVALAVSIAAIVAIGVDEYMNRARPIDKGFDVPLVVGAFERGVREYFAEREIENELIVVDNFAPFMQARIQQPVMANWMLGSYIIYTPDFAPPIQKLFRDVYGISFGESIDGRLPRQPEVWRALWASRTQADWQALRDAYEVRYLIAPLDLELPMEPLVAADGQGLYELPR